MEKKRVYTAKLGQAVANRSQKIDATTYHVIAGNNDGWAVVPQGSVKAIKAFPTQKEAIEFAGETAHKKAGTVVVHAVTGQIEDRISYGEPFNKEG